MTEFLPKSKWVHTIGMVVTLLVCMTGNLFAQSRSISGVIKGDDGATLPGVSILEKGTRNGVVTDTDGRFTMTIGNDATLVISFIGMQTQEVVVGTRTTLDVTLITDITELSEVVVIGYGTQKKSDLTGSIVSIGGDDLKKVPVASVAESLTGRLAGVQVSGAEGSPDAEVRIRVRGGGSITQDNSPLYIVDGFPVNTIADITPSDIQSIDVLKDASSTAIYGSRGANGVIIITTKSGKDGRLTVSYNSFAGFRRIANTLDVLSPEDYVKWQYEYAAMRFGTNSLSSYENIFGAWGDIDLYRGIPANNWQEQVYGRTGTVFSNDIGVRGGSDKFQYTLNYARFDDKAIMIGSGFTRNNITMKLNNKPNKKVDIAFSLRYSDTEITGGGANEQNEVSSQDSRLRNSIQYPPLSITGLSSADTDESVVTSLIQPLIATADNDRLQTRKNYNMAGSFSWKAFKNFDAKTEFGLDNFNYTDDRFYGRTTYYVGNAPSGGNQGKPALIKRDRREVRIRNTNTLNYDFKEFLPDDHHLKFLLGHEIIHSEVSNMTSILHGFPSLFTSTEAFKLTSQADPQSVDNFLLPDDDLLSFFGRINYDFRGRYLLSATYRADGSSKFLGRNRWGYFPSAAIAWKLSEENFMQGASGWLDLLKVRFSYGAAGNNNIPTGQTFQAFESRRTTWMNPFEDFWAPSSIMANPNLRWETTYTRNIGLDFGVMQGRLTGSLEAYLNNTTDLLILFPTPGTGYLEQYRNIGETENKGLEASFNFIAVETSNYGLNFSFNIGMNRNRVKSLGSLAEISEMSRWASTDIPFDYLLRVGGSVGQMYGFVSDGRYEVSDFEGYNPATGNWILGAGVPNGQSIIGRIAPGTMKLKDIDGNGVIDLNDRQFIGDFNPKHTGGFVINGYAYGFDLTAAFNWSYGNSVYNANKIEYTTATPRTQFRNLIDIMAEGNRWTNIDPSTGGLVTDPQALATLNANTTMWSPYMDRFIFSDWAVEDGSFLRLNTLTLGYSLPASIIERLRIQSLRFYLTGYNVFILTNYSGFDPEVSTRRRNALTPGVDYSAYPRSRQLAFGLNLTF